MGFWNSFWSLFGGAHAKAAPQSFGAATFAGIARTGRPPVRGQAELLQAYSNNPRFRSVVDRISHTVAATPWRPHKLVADSKAVQKAFGRGKNARKHIIQKLHQAGPMRRAFLKRMGDDGAVEALDQHPALDLLNAPNPHLTAAQVRQLTCVYLEVVGEGFLVVERYEKSAQPAELWPIPPPWVRRMPVEDDNTYDIRYPNAGTRLVPAENVIWLKYPDPLNPYSRGTGIGSTLNNEIDTDEYAAQTAAKMFWNNATPDMIVSVKGLGPEELQDYKRKWLDEQGGYQRAKLPRFTNGDIDVKQLQSSFADMELVKLREFERNAIREAYAIPPEIVGVTGSSNRAAITEAQRLFGLNVLIPRLDMLEDYINNVLMPMYGDESEDVVMLYENPLPEDLDSEQTARTTAPWSLTINEWRKHAGEEPLDGPEGELHMVPISLTPTRLEDVEKEQAEAKEQAQQQQESGVNHSEQASTGSGTGSGGGGVGEGGEQGVSGGQKPPEPVAGGKRHRGQLIILPPSRKEEQQDERERRDERIDAVLDAVDGDEMYQAMAPLWHEQLLEWVSQEMQQLGADASLDVVGKLTQEHLRDLAGDRIEMVADTTRSALGESLAEGIDNGETLRDLIGRVRGVFDDASTARAETIARTETARSSNWAIHAGQKLSGITKREWVANQDSRTRDAHAALDGEVVGIDQPFRIEGASAMYPGGFGVAELDIQCRCVTSAVVGDDDAEERSIKTPRRVAAWKAFDRRLSAWERRAVSVIRQGFARQEREAQKALRRAFGVKAVG